MAEVLIAGGGPLIKPGLQFGEDPLQFLLVDQLDVIA
jgi:hypothetical protein